MQDQVEIYELNGITFILLPTKTLIRTKYQTFTISPARHNFSKRMERLRDEIRQGRMQSMTEVVSFCNLKPGRRGQMLGIQMTNTLYSRHDLSNLGLEV